MGFREIVVRMGLSRQHIHQLAECSGFFAPVALLCMARVWRATDIESWLLTYYDPDERA
jgi:predicted DNA-binding transcriptional regulator AlpA